jgi:transposase
MRVADLFKRLLGLPGMRVAGVELTERAGGPLVLVRLARPARRAMACSGCGQVVRAAYDRAERRWRHRDLGGVRCELVAEVRRLSCPACGVRPEALPFARPGSRFTRPFEDSCAWLARHAPRAVVAELMRIDWETVGRMAGRVIAESRRGGDGLGGLVRIGVDEVSWKAGHHYLTAVSCHDAGRVVWAGAGDRRAALGRFFDELGPARARRIEAISADLGPAYLAVIRARAPKAAICADPFHLVAMAHFALDRVRAASWQELRIADPARARWLKGARFALRRGPGRRSGAD